MIRPPSAPGSTSGSSKPAFISYDLSGWGDSRTAQNWTTTTTVPAPLARGPLWQAELRSKGALRLSHLNNQGKSGDSVQQVADRIRNDTPNDYGVKPSQVPIGVAFNLFGTNTVVGYTGSSAQGTVKQYVAAMIEQATFIIDWQLNRGFHVIQALEWPRGLSASPQTALLTPAQQQVMLRYRRELLKLSVGRSQLYFSDVWPRAAAPTATDCTPRPNILNGDYLHNSPGIAVIQGESIWRIVETQIIKQKLPNLVASNADLYDADNNPEGCLNTNPTLQATGGTVGTNATGAAPAGYTLSAGAGMTVAGSFTTVTLPNGETRNAFLMDCSGTPTSNNAVCILRMSGLLTKILAGDTLESAIEVYVPTGHVNFASPCLMIDTGATASRLHGGLSLTGDYQMATEAVGLFDGVARSAKGTLDTLPASLSYQFGGSFTLSGVASSAKIYLLGSALRKVT